MGLFGSRDDDPLLQNDPLAPSADESPTEGEEASSDPDRASAQRRDRPGRVETRTLAYTEEEATDGALADLNRALIRHWRLTRVQLREDGQLLFRLRRHSGAADEEGTII
jgi:hypothetical protein